MAFQHRKLMSDNDTLTDDDHYCIEKLGCDLPCPSSCFPFCSKFCSYPGPPSPTGSDPSSKGMATGKLLIITFTVLSVAFLVLCYYIYYVRFSRARSNARRRSQPETTETRDEFLDEDQGPIVDHHVWYINTVGLQQSIIDSIAVCKYKRGEGLVEGTECSVCLNEFEEDETLRLLPKCSHAFHISCIDTWLRSHTNCPMCRAPIVSNTANTGPSLSEVNANDSVVNEETQVVITEDDREQPDRQTEAETSETRVRTEAEQELTVENVSRTGESSRVEDEIQPMRRSVSLDSLAASQISQAIADVLPEGSSQNSHNGVVKEKESSFRIVPRRGAGNQSLIRLMYRSSIRRSLQTKPIFMKRSFSFNGKFSLPISNNKDRNKNPPVRSF